MCRSQDEERDDSFASGSGGILLNCILCVSVLQSWFGGLQSLNDVIALLLFSEPALTDLHTFTVLNTIVSILHILYTTL